LQDADVTVQRNAAMVLARLPTQKDPAALPVLIDALNMDKVRDPKAYEPLYIPSQSTTVMRDGEHMQDDIWRLQAIQALKDFGPGATEALPLLREMADRIPATNDYKLRDYALIAIGTLDPAAAPSDAIAEVSQEKRATELREKAKSGTASFDELVEGLQDERSAGYSAQQLQKSSELARKALSELEAAVDRFGDLSSAEAIGKINPDVLVSRLKNRKWNGLYAVAEALGDLGPAMDYAIPYLEEAFSPMKPNDPALLAVGDALQKINPGYPKPIFHWDDLHDATTALLNEIYRTDKIRGSVYQTYISDFQDINNITRPQLLRFIDATKADPELHRVFVEKLLEKNPALASQLQGKKVSSR
jgi:hypothetical protein